MNNALLRNLIDVRDLIKTVKKESFKMNDFWVEDNVCGTAGCIAGHAVLATGKFFVDNVFDHYGKDLKLKHLSGGTTDWVVQFANILQKGMKKEHEEMIVYLANTISLGYGRTDFYELPDFLEDWTKKHAVLWLNIWIKRLKKYTPKEFERRLETDEWE